ncbi:alpha-mannosidase [Paenibacillus sp.]|uniref:alpha-mannosidase n=1 Tax=Paenibacillus sp. TaxID=58172 RepID=UPI002D2B6761|nr:alpha-mannosidase [Paenibacillus sp.]HZG86472.1 alpha-mannosidase [Paenibacillus sp.]
MFYTEEKLSMRIDEIGVLRYRHAQPLEAMETLPDDETRNGVYPPEGGVRSIVRMGDRWKGRDAYIWLLAKVRLPDPLPGHRIIGRFDFGKTYHGNNQGFESLLFVDGKPYQGVDSNHQEVFLDRFGSRSVELAFRLWSGLEGGGAPTPQEHEIKRAEIAYLHEGADDLYYTARATASTVRVLSADSPERHRLLSALDRAFKLIDWTCPGSDAFYASVADARAALSASLAEMESNHPVTVRCIGHTHIDVAWLWRLRHTREKAARSFSTVLRLMEEYPDYIFLQTQPQLYEYMKQDYPEIYEKIRERVSSGAWEAGGAMWLESDCNLTSGESLVRQILFGTRFFREEFGVECRYLWLPDVFGYSSALPQILRKSGITSFMTTKISWSQYNRMPHDTFYWRGIDGSELLTHFITTPEIEFPHETYYTYNGYVVPETVSGIWRNYRDKSVNQELLLCYGYGDGGGGVNRDMLEMRRRLESMPGLPKAVPGRADDYFAKLEETVAATDQYVHVWDGELYMENHRGTYTSQAFIKKANRRMELSLRAAELRAVTAGLLGGYDLARGQALLNEAWKITLRNQFHDIIPGSSIAEVYDDARLEYEEAERLVAAADREANDALMAPAAAANVGSPTVRAYTIYNSASWERDGLVAVPEEQAENGLWRRSDGTLLEAQRTENGWLVAAAAMPAMGFETVTFEPNEAARENEADSFVWLGDGIDTPYYQLRWNAAGQLERIYDKTFGRDVLAPGALGNELQVFEDKPMQFDAWNIDLFYQEKMRTVDALSSVELVELGSLRAIVAFEWTYADSTIRQEMHLYAKRRRIDFRTEVDWREHHQLLKAAFPVDVRAAEATYDIQYGNVKRPTHWNTSWDYARFETVGHQWADLSERGYGVSLLNDCKYGYDIKDNVMRISLIKSATYPDPNADQGAHAFTYSLLPHGDDWAAGGTVEEAWDLNDPARAAAGAALRERFSFLRASAGHIAFDAVKKSEDGDGIIVRFHEFEGRRGTVTIDSDLTIDSWQETDLMERPIGDVRDGALECLVRPYEIKTFLVRFRP